MFEGFEYECDPRLETVVNQFYNEAYQRGVLVHKDRLIIRIGQLNTTANCVKTYQGCTITVNESFFRHGNPDPVAMQYIVFHEFGHYIGRDHNDSFSIMNPNVYAATFKNDTVARKQLIDELFMK